MTLRLALLLVVAARVAAFAQAAPLTIHGRVFAADDRAALPRARVTIMVDGAGSLTYTDDQGRFEVTVPPGAVFTLSVLKAGFAAMLMPLQREALAAAPRRELAIALTRAAAVNGRVVDTTGATVVGLRVYADRLDPDPDTPAGLIKFATTTDDRGEYRLGGLPPGRYSVTATGAQDPGAVATLVLRPGDDLSDIGFTALPPPVSAIESSPQPPETRERATIRGRVLTTAGRPISQAVVNITGPMPPRYFVTDAQGRFAFTGLSPGDYQLQATRGDFLPGTAGQQTAFESSSRVAVTGGARVNNVTLVLSRGLAVTGTIVDRAGEPLQGVAVQALQLSASGERRRAALAGALVGGSRQTDDRGRYRVLGLEPGTYLIAALADVSSLGGGAASPQTVPVYYPGSPSIEGAVTVAVATTDVAGVDFAVGDVPSARVMGAAFDSTGVPLDGTITLAVSHRSGSIVPTPRTTHTGSDGAFTFFNVAPGDYVVQAVKLPGPGAVQFDPRLDLRDTIEFDARYVTVGDHDAEPVSLRTSRGAVVEARIVSDSAVPHDPYERMQIEGYPIGFDLSPISLVTFGDQGRVVDGRVRIGGLTGPRRFALSGMPDGWYLKSLTIDGSDVTDQVVDFGVGAGRTVSAEVVISANGGSITGRATSFVVVFPEDREKWFERSRFVRLVRASQDGSFRASSLPPSDYYVAATATAVESEVTTPDTLELLKSRAVRVTVNEGEERSVELLP